MLQITDTHCHIHEKDYPDAKKSIQEAQSVGITNFICIGTDLESSKIAVQFSKDHKKEGAFAAIGIHPHEATEEKLKLNLSRKVWDELEELAKQPEVVAIGEFGFDFFYHDPKELTSNQMELARRHLQLASKLNLPVVLHVRNAFNPFFELIRDFPEVSGVIHSFSDQPEILKRILSLENNFYIGLNGIITFTNDSGQLQSAKNVPLERLVLETDAPYLTPTPLRGTINNIKNTLIIAQFLSDLRGEELEKLCEVTTSNAKRLFKLK
jgi:TatD DNase family protein